MVTQPLERPRVPEPDWHAEQQQRTEPLPAAKAAGRPSSRRSHPGSAVNTVFGILADEVGLRRRHPRAGRRPPRAANPRLGNPLQRSPRRAGPEDPRRPRPRRAPGRRSHPFERDRYDRLWCVAHVDGVVPAVNVRVGDQTALSKPTCTGRPRAWGRLTTRTSSSTRLADRASGQDQRQAGHVPGRRPHLSRRPGSLARPAEAVPVPRRAAHTRLPQPPRPARTWTPRRAAPRPRRAPRPRPRQSQRSREVHPAHRAGRRSGRR